MLKFFAKLESLFNNLFFKFIDLFITTMKRILPRRTIYKIEDIHYSVIYRWARLKENSKKKRKQLWEDAIVKKNELFQFLQQAQKYKFREKVDNYLDQVKTFFKETTFKQYIKYIVQIFTYLFSQGKNFINRFSPQMVKLTLASISIIIIATVSIVNQGRFIWFSENPFREPAKVEDFADKPSYYNRTAKIMVIRNVRIPIIVKNVREINSVTMEFSVRTTTRFAKLFLEEKEHIVRDHLFMNLQPIVSDFPIEEEGKRVLTEKLQIELNYLLQKEKVEGSVDMVRVLYIIGS